VLSPQATGAQRRALFRDLARRQDRRPIRRFHTEVGEGMVVSERGASNPGETGPTNLAVRELARPAKCGSCSAEINGKPCLMCMTRLGSDRLSMPVSRHRFKRFSPIKDLVTGCSRGISRSRRRSKPFKPRKPDAAPMEPGGCGRKTIESRAGMPQMHRMLLCQDVCHVLRRAHKHAEFIGPRFFRACRGAGNAPADTENRVADLKHRDGIVIATSTNACTQVCPETSPSRQRDHSLKERVVDEFSTPLRKLFASVPITGQG